jgi:acyl transferase domain-containing protein/acyl carrier protein
MNDEAIAVIGIGCRLPGGVASPDELWRAVIDGRDLVTEVPPARWDAGAVYDPEPGVPGRTVSRWGGFLDDVAGFDLGFFGIGRAEAVAADPQQRILLEVAWEAIEHAGIDPGSLAGSRTGVFAGTSYSDYLLRHRDAGTVQDPYTTTGTALSVASGRIAYLLDLRGPALTVDTACSSSLVAVHLACQSLRTGECDLALAGGVTIILGPEMSVSYSGLGMLSRHGRCQAFSENRDGFVRSEGCGVVLLKPLAAARADGDRVLAVLRGSAINQDGRSDGLAAPTVSAQVRVQQTALADAGVDPATVGYLEAHGTGTPVGDPVEMAALVEVYGASRQRRAVGSVKTNLGHTEPAAGVIGLIKAVQTVRHGVIAPNLHFSGWGAGVDPGESGLFVPVQTTPWPVAEGPRRAGVSSYGFSGTNAHLLLEQAPVDERAPGQDHREAGPWVFPISSSTPQSLAATAERVADWLQGDGRDVPLPDIGYTLARRRAHRPARAAVVAASRHQLCERLRSVAEGRPSPGTATGAVRGKRLGTVWVFSGQGSQWAGMGRSLLATEPAFAATIESLEPLVGAEAGFSLLDTVRADSVVTGMERVQPTLFAIQVALAETWRSYGMQPAAVIGHSMGEVAAAVVGGALSPQDGVAVICRRSRLLAGLEDAGALGSVDLPADQVAAEIAAAGLDGVVVGVVSSPGQCVVSGDTAQVAQLLERWQERGLMARPVAAPVASHSPQMDPILPRLRERLAGLHPGGLRTGFYGTVLEDSRRRPVFDAAYWAANLRRPVRFMSAVTAALEDGYRTFVEISPHPLLTYAIAETAGQAQREAVALPTLRRDEEEQDCLLTQLGAVHCAEGVDWSLTYPCGTLADVPLPAWHHEPLMIEPTPPSGTAGHPLLGAHIQAADAAGVHLWQADVGTGTLPWLADHRVNDVPVLPGAAYCEMALAALSDLFDDAAGEVTDVEFQDVLLLDEHTILSATSHQDLDDRTVMEIMSRGDEGTLTRHATAVLRPGATLTGKVDLGQVFADHPERATPDDLYRRLRESGITHGPRFAALTAIHHAGPAFDTVVGRVSLPAELRAQDAAFRLHPVLLDACLQTLAAHPALAALGELMLPLGCAALRVAGDPRRGRFCLAHLRQARDRAACGDLRLLAEDGTVLVEMTGVRFGGAAQDTPDQRFDSRLWTMEWEAGPPPPGDQVPGGTILIVTEDTDDGLAAATAEALRPGGTVCEILHAPLGGDGDEQMAEALDAGLSGVVLLAPPPTPLDETSVERAHLRVRRITRLTQALVGEHGGDLPRVWVITRQAQPVGAEDGLNTEQTAMRGLCRVLMSEHAELKTVYIDIDDTTTATDLRAELLTDAAEDEVAWRDGRRHLARLRIAPLGLHERRRTTAVFGHDGIALDSARRGDLDALELIARDRVPPGPGEVELRVHAAALNYMDLLNAMGIYKTVDGVLPPFGVDCAGEVVAVGPGVETVRMGDRVAAFGAGGLASFQTVPAWQVLPLADGVSWASAAAQPAVYVTAWHSLKQLAALRAGERVLIHSASGGVGPAAIAIAKAIGAQVYATAGNIAKRDYVRALGVEHVLDSRSLDFAAQIRELTGGEGVDVVLNTLTGPAMRAGLDLLRTGGRFIELAKKDIYADSKIGLFPFRRNITLSSVDLGLLHTERPALLATAIAEVAAELAAGRLPEPQVTTFSLDQATTAFRTLAAATHIGKLVLTIPQSGTADVVVPPDAFPLARPDGAYVITGGLGGLGLLLGRWLAEQGAARIVLNGRSAPTPDAERVIADLVDGGTDVVVELGDIAVGDTAERLIGAATTTGLPLSGVMHAAAVVPESPIGRLDDTLLRRGWQAKCAGAWKLHQAACGTRPDWWFNFSSGACLIGFPGLGAYAAACSWLDGFTRWQRAQGVPASSVAWGAWSDHGLGQAFAERGYEMISVQEGLDACDRLLRHDRVLTGYIPAQKPGWLRLFGSTIESSFLSGLGTANPMRTRDTGLDNEITAELTAAEPSERRRLVTAFITDQAATILGLDPTSIDPDRQLKDAGLDSLMALELRTRMEKGTSIRVPTKTLWTHGSLTQLATHILDQLNLTPSRPVGDA